MGTEEVAGVSNTKDGFCALCSDRKSLYLCPRCNIPYCSMECYKNESHKHCTENFYYEQVKSHLALNQKISDGATEKDVEEILRRQMQSNEADDDPVDSDDDSDVPDLADRLAEVDIDDADELWKHLTPDEQQAFQAALSSGAAFDLVPDWAPWWGQMYRTKVITKDFMNACRKRSPVVSTKIVDYNKLTKKPPVEHLIYNIVNVLAAYSFTCRYFNGNHMELADKAATCIAHLSLTLMCNKQYSSFAEAVACVSEETTRDSASSNSSRSTPEHASRDVRGKSLKRDNRPPPPLSSRRDEDTKYRNRGDDRRESKDGRRESKDDRRELKDDRRELKDERRDDRRGDAKERYRNRDDRYKDRHRDERNSRDSRDRYRDDKRSKQRSSSRERRSRSPRRAEHRNRRSNSRDRDGRDSRPSYGRKYERYAGAKGAFEKQDTQKPPPVEEQKPKQDADGNRFFMPGIVGRFRDQIEIRVS